MIAPRCRVYTPAPLAERLAALALEGWPADVSPRVCDPACGDGALLDAVRAQRPDAQLWGADLDGGALSAARARLPATLLETDALAHAWGDAPFDIVIANPPWVSYSGRQAAPLVPTARAALRERFQLFRSWPSLHAAFVELAVRLASGRVALLLPAQICDLERYGPVRAFLRAHGALTEPAIALGEDAFDGVVQPSCMLLLDRRGVSTRQGDAPIPFGTEAATYPSLLDRLDRPPPELFADVGVHTGNCSRRLIGDRGAPIREGRDIDAFVMHSPRRRFDDAAVPADGEYFRASPLDRYRGFPIVLRQTADRPIAALHREPTYFRNSVLACRGLPGVADALVVAWLNSSLVARYHRARVRESGQRVFPQVKVRHLRDLPWPDLRAAPAHIVQLAKAAPACDLNELDRAWERWLISIQPPSPR